jgi:hypothetical protein
MDIKKPKMTSFHYEMKGFHFKMDIEMMDKLTDLELFEKTQSMSGTIKMILLQLFPVIEKEDYKEVQRFSKYRLIHNDTEIKRVRVVARIPDFLYRRLKSLHDVLNYYSMAQLIRDLLGLYLDLVDEYGNGFGDELMRIIKDWSSFSRNSRVLIHYIRQLLTFQGDMMEILYFFNVYSHCFSPYRKFRLT